MPKPANQPCEYERPKLTSSFYFIPCFPPIYCQHIHCGRDNVHKGDPSHPYHGAGEVLSSALGASPEPGRKTSLSLFQCSPEECINDNEQSNSAFGKGKIVLNPIGALEGDVPIPPIPSQTGIAKVMQEQGPLRELIRKDHLRLGMPWPGISHLVSEEEQRLLDECWKSGDIGRYHKLGSLRKTDLEHSKQGPGDTLVNNNSIPHFRTVCFAVRKAVPDHRKPLQKRKQSKPNTSMELSGGVHSKRLNKQKRNILAPLSRGLQLEDDIPCLTNHTPVPKPLVLAPQLSRIITRSMMKPVEAAPPNMLVKQHLSKLSGELGGRHGVRYRRNLRIYDWLNQVHDSQNSNETCADTPRKIGKPSNK